MKNDYDEPGISEIAKELKNKIQGGTIFGERCDLNNIDHCLVSAYFIGRHEAEEEAFKERIRLIDIFGKKEKICP